EVFADGVLVDEEAWEHGQATARTRQLMTDPNVGAIFEAAFEHAGVRVRVDVLERVAPRAWGLREVKRGTSVKDYYLDDAAVQRFVVEGQEFGCPRSRSCTSIASTCAAPTASTGGGSSVAPTWQPRRLPCFPTCRPACESSCECWRSARRRMSSPRRIASIH